MIEANTKKDGEMLREVNDYLRSIRDTWKQVMRINRERGQL